MSGGKSRGIGCEPETERRRSPPPDRCSPADVDGARRAATRTRRPGVTRRSGPIIRRVRYPMRLRQRASSRRLTLRPSARDSPAQSCSSLPIGSPRHGSRRSGSAPESTPLQQSQEHWIGPRITTDIQRLIGRGSGDQLSPAPSCPDGEQSDRDQIVQRDSRRVVRRWTKGLRSEAASRSASILPGDSLRLRPDLHLSGVGSICSQSLKTPDESPTHRHGKANSRGSSSEAGDLGPITTNGSGIPEELPLFSRVSGGRILPTQQHSDETSSARDATRHHSREEDGNHMGNRSGIGRQSALQFSIDVLVIAGLITRRKDGHSHSDEFVSCVVSSVHLFEDNRRSFRWSSELVQASSW